MQQKPWQHYLRENYPISPETPSFLVNSYDFFYIKFKIQNLTENLLNKHGIFSDRLSDWVALCFIQHLNDEKPENMDTFDEAFDKVSSFIEKHEGHLEAQKFKLLIDTQILLFLKSGHFCHPDALFKFLNEGMFVLDHASIKNMEARFLSCSDRVLSTYEHPLETWMQSVVSQEIRQKLSYLKAAASNPSPKPKLNLPSHHDEILGALCFAFGRNFVKERLCSESLDNCAINQNQEWLVEYTSPPASFEQSSASWSRTTSLQKRVQNLVSSERLSFWERFIVCDSFEQSWNLVNHPEPNLDPPSTGEAIVNAQASNAASDQYAARSASPFSSFFHTFQRPPAIRTVIPGLNGDEADETEVPEVETPSLFFPDAPPLIVPERAASSDTGTPAPGAGVTSLFFDQPPGGPFIIPRRSSSSDCAGKEAPVDIHVSTTSVQKFPSSPPDESFNEEHGSAKKTGSDEVEDFDAFNRTEHNIRLHEKKFWAGFSWSMASVALLSTGASLFFKAPLWILAVSTTFLFFSAAFTILNSYRLAQYDRRSPVSTCAAG